MCEMMGLKHDEEVERKDFHRVAREVARVIYHQVIAHAPVNLRTLVGRSATVLT